ncbi:substrate-binding periplasmic protein [Spartinivicinus poritis]|uniref:Transporter substrate-binding domain-containing protein n=1 Tax=Spartinivicinus poritis TaxID=2994640 RepID=A0ABT5U5I5_9GAMM|nr:transporter substrate-binding domain-containing protein [Spartinivicinus sp. A2-2]MDE1461567.1 transporter substrate-binding domain-containing protein [Spartinivicinus sp. A2-2]
MKIKLLFFFVVLHYVSHAWAGEVNYVVIKSQAQPFQIENDGKQHSGIVTDIVKEVFKNSEYQLTTRTFPFKRMISIMEEKKYKNWVTFGSPAWPGIQNENLSAVPIYSVKNIMLIKKPGFNYTSTSDLFGKTVILMDGFDYPGLEELIKQGKVKEIRVKDHSSAFKILDRPVMTKFTGFIELKVRVLYNLRKTMRNTDDYQMVDVSSIANNYDIHLAYSNQIDKNIQLFINDRLKTIKNNGRLSDIVSKYNK